MTEQTAPPVHFYEPSGVTFAERVLCHLPDRGINTHVTEYGNQVTCPTCAELLRARMAGDEEWADQ